MNNYEGYFSTIKRHVRSNGRETWIASLQNKHGAYIRVGSYASPEEAREAGKDKLEGREPKPALPPERTGAHTRAKEYKPCVRVKRKGERVFYEVSITCGTFKPSFWVGNYSNKEEGIAAALLKIKGQDYPKGSIARESRPRSSKPRSSTPRTLKKKEDTQRKPEVRSFYADRLAMIKRLAGYTA